MGLNVLLISTYEMGRQPFGVASSAAWLRQTGAEVRCLDLSVDAFSEPAVEWAQLAAFYVPMHMATRMAVPALERVRQVNPNAHICFFGLYAWENAAYLRDRGVQTILGGEFEHSIAKLARDLAGSSNGRPAAARWDPILSLERQKFLVPDRSDLPELGKYARLMTPDGRSRVTGYAEASRGCKHLCRHCPVVPVYQGHFRVVQRDVVLEDIRRQVAAGAEHITFGDPDFFNGVGHAIPLITALHAEHPDLTFDVTIKVEHLLRHARYLPMLKDTGCRFVTSAVESFEDPVLDIFRKNHTRADFEAVLGLCRAIGLALTPTFVAFTPWTTLTGYRSFLADIARLDLIEQVAPVQYSIRLLVPPGSLLLELPEVQSLLEGLDPGRLSYVWRNPDPRVDQLQKDIEGTVRQASSQRTSRADCFRRICEAAFGPAELPPEVRDRMGTAAARCTIPYLTEPWYC